MATLSNSVMELIRLLLCAASAERERERLSRLLLSDRRCVRPILLSERRCARPMNTSLLRRESPRLLLRLGCLAWLLLAG